MLIPSSVPFFMVSSVSLVSDFDEVSQRLILILNSSSITNDRSSIPSTISSGPSSVIGSSVSVISMVHLSPSDVVFSTPVSSLSVVVSMEFSPSG